MQVPELLIEVFDNSRSFGQLKHSDSPGPEHVKQFSKHFSHYNVLGLP